MSACSPHRWNVEQALPIYKDHDQTLTGLTCQHCGRYLDVMDTSPNMRASIAQGIASRLYEGDEYSEVHEAVMAFWSAALGRSR